MLVPFAGLVAFAVASGLAGCSTVAAPAPEPTSAASASPTGAAPVEPVAIDTPTTVEALPGSALMRVSVTAGAGDEEVRLELTFARAQTGVSAPGDLQAVQRACPNAIASQLDLHPGFEPTGVVTSELSMTGDWPAGMTFAVAAGGVIASFGEGRSVAETSDEPGMFGCTVPIVTGPGTASFTSLLLGDPAVPDREDLEGQLARGIFGFESDSSSTVDVRWSDCVIQLSSAAQRLSTESGWTLPARWGDGCLIGDPGTV